MQNIQKATRAVKRVTAKHSDKQMTDQSYKKSCCINNIVKQFQKTGKIPESNKVPQFGDFSEVPSLEQAYEVTIAAAKTFNALPADIRKLIDNNPSQLESFVLNDDNKEICYKHGLLTKPELVQDPRKRTETVKTEVTNEPVKTEENSTST